MLVKVVSAGAALASEQSVLEEANNPLVAWKDPGVKLKAGGYKYLTEQPKYDHKVVEPFRVYKDSVYQVLILFQVKGD